MVAQALKKIDHYIVPYFKVSGKKSPFAQAKEMWSLYRKYESLPTQYMVSSLYQNEATRDVMSFMPSSLLRNFQERVNDPAARDLVFDKHLFRVTLEAHGLPVIRELFRILQCGEIRDAEDRAIDKNAARNILAAHNAPVFVKPTFGTRGKGAFISAPGDDVDEIFQSTSGVLVQPVLQQHPTIAAIKPGVINSVRIDTLLTDGRCVNSAAVQKLGQGDAPVDNGGHGGLVVQIDLETGRLTRLAKQKARFGPEAFSVHPDTGASFAGTQIPFWSELRTIVCRAAFALPELPTLGWDVAVTPDGPVLIEANSLWHIDNLQYGDTGIGDTPVGKAALHMKRTGQFRR
ncbi:MAG: hypothetical protein OEN23_03870 [Paracoccaceae bacterium]|nr:hypothetical protein [Paracoccaceae bacterium]